MVHDVDDQKTCGSCYAFSTVGVIEGALLRNNITTRLSMQQIIDCDKADDGCDGGEPISALQYAKKFGLSSVDSYPYTSNAGKCKPFTPVSKLSSIGKKTLNGDENRLKRYVSTFGPVAGKASYNFSFKLIFK